MNNPKNLSPLWWLWVPVAGAAAQTLMEVFLSRDTLAALHTESGPHEWIQFLLILAAFFVASRLLFILSWRKEPLMATWLFLAALCCFYVAGEEVSWGQHVMQWSTPEEWTRINDQQETNLHNTSDWLDQKPRLFLLIGVAAGGLLIPFLQKICPALLPGRFNAFYPPKELSFIALLIVGFHLLEKFLSMAGIYIFTRFSEVEEVYLFYFVLLYLIALGQREIRKTPPG
ncbi:MAG: hypothetical protein H6853_01940 [Rhodospirillales bacterium]|nr:hypothetical protein [Alphaproteobacteria bacterium]USO04062.1 MAG: hypothetical protein H6853_01940 [Rhodospirillales bacterium]